MHDNLNLTNSNLNLRPGIDKVTIDENHVENRNTLNNLNQTNSNPTKWERGKKVDVNLNTANNLKKYNEGKKN